jgi:hypothetical protein
VAQTVERLLYKHEALSSNPCPNNKKEIEGKKSLYMVSTNAQKYFQSVVDWICEGGICTYEA